MEAGSELVAYDRAMAEHPPDLELTAAAASVKTELGATLGASLDATLEAAPRYTNQPFEAARGQSIGRYMVISKLGAGAMGVVLAASSTPLRPSA